MSGFLGLQCTDRVQPHLNKREGAVEIILSRHYSLEDSMGVSQTDSEKNNFSSDLTANEVCHALHIHLPKML